MRTLIVEDQTMFRDMLVKLCRAHLGHAEVREAGDVAGAVRLLEQEHFDLLLVDIVLPDGEGFEVAEKATALPAPPRIVGMSGHSRAGCATTLMRFRNCSRRASATCAVHAGFTRMFRMPARSFDQASRGGHHH